MRSAASCLGARLAARCCRRRGYDPADDRRVCAGGRVGALCPIASVDSATLVQLCKLPEADTETLTGKDRDVPICTNEATSGVAPLPLMAGSKGRIEATTSCSSHHSLQQLTTSSPDDTPNRPPSALAEATLALAALLPPPAAPAVLDRLAHPRGPHAGVRVGVYRPPRS